MSPLLGLRLWLREAPRAEVATWAAGLLVVMLVTVWALAPVGTPRTDDAVVVADPGGVGSAQPGATATTGAGGTPGGGGSGAAGVTGPGGGAPVDGTGTAGVTTGARDGSTTGGVTDGSGTGMSTGGRPTPGLRATDRGVTAREVKLGFIIVNLGGADAAGAALGIRTDIPQVIDALVADANRRGGAAGRKIVAMKYRVDPLNEQDARRKCIQMTQSDKVFAVSDSGVYVYDSTASCLTVENRTPVVGTTGLTAAYMRRAAPLHITIQKDTNRVSRDLVFGAKAAGLFDPRRGFTGVGLLTEDCLKSVSTEVPGLRSNLRAAGVRDDQISEFRASCDTATGQRQMAQAVLQHKNDRVSVVLPTIVHTSFTNYLQQANVQLFRPRYFGSDYRQFTSDAVARTFSPDQWDGTMALSQRRDGELNATKRLSPLAQRCSKVFTDAGLPGVQDYGRDGESLAHCQNLELFVKLANAAGAELTRGRLAGAVASVGRFDPARDHTAVFDRPEKYSGGEYVQPVVWRRGCTCWVATGPVRRALG